MISIKVNKILSHQTESKKRVAGYGRKAFVHAYTTKAYKDYVETIGSQLDELETITSNKPVRVDLVFRIEGGVKPKEYAVIQKHNNYTVRVLESLESVDRFIHDSKHPREYYTVQERSMEVKFGVVGDKDNISKPVYDALELKGKIPNDNQIVAGSQTKIYGCKENEILISMEELELEDVVDKENK